MKVIRKAITGLGSALRLKDADLLGLLPFAVYVTALLLFSVYQSHRVDQLVHTIDRLEQERQLLEAEHTETKERLAKLSLESRIVHRAEELGLVQPTERPRIIVQTAGE